jgi:hypothetical protein
MKNENKGVSNPNSHMSFPSPQHFSNVGYFNGFMHKIKISMPKFGGDNDREGTTWIDKLECYFEISQIHDDENKIDFVFMHLNKLAYDMVKLKTLGITRRFGSI